MKLSEAELEAIARKVAADCPLPGLRFYLGPQVGQLTVRACRWEGCHRENGHAWQKLSCAWYYDLDEQLQGDVERIFLCRQAGAFADLVGVLLK